MASSIAQTFRICGSHHRVETYEIGDDGLSERKSLSASLLGEEPYLFQHLAKGHGAVKLHFLLLGLGLSRGMVVDVHLRTMFRDVCGGMSSRGRILRRNDCKGRRATYLEHALLTLLLCLPGNLLHFHALYRFIELPGQLVRFGKRHVALEALEWAVKREGG